MTRARFTQQELTRAINAFEKAGLGVARVRFLPDGGFEIIAGEAEKGDNSNWFSGSPLYRDVA
jgi:hypothetical protein